MTTAASCGPLAIRTDKYDRSGPEVIDSHDERSKTCWTLILAETPDIRVIQPGEEKREVSDDICLEVDPGVSQRL